MSKKARSSPPALEGEAAALGGWMGKPAEKGQGPAAGHVRLPLCLRVTGKQDSGSFLGVKETTGTGFSGE